MGKKSGQQVTQYLMSMHLGIATKVDALTGLLIDKLVVWTGNETASAVVPINKPNFKGGPTQEGGYVGNMYYLDGGPTQTMPDELAAKFGLTPTTMPGFRGLATVFFTGPGGPSGFGGLFGAIFDVVLGPNRGSLGGFIWSTNNPTIASNVSLKVKRAPKGLDPTTAMIVSSVEVTTVVHTVTTGDVTSTTTQQYIEGTDPGFQIFFGDSVNTVATDVNMANPAHCIYEVMTDTEQGMGTPTTAIDTDSFTAAAATLFAEGTGFATKWDTQGSCEDFINDILSIANAMLFLSPLTGLWTMKLVRGDYDISTLSVFNPENATMSNYQRRLWGETTNEIQVTWTNPLNEQPETVSVQNLSNIAIQSQNGVVSDTRNYYGARTAALATALATREVTLASAPLRSMDMEVDRSAWSQTPAGVVIVNWPEYRLSNIAMRIAEVDYGKAGDASIKIKLIEDIFALQAPVIVAAPGTAWANTATAPTPLSQELVITLPAFFVGTGSLQDHPILLSSYPDTLGAVLGYTIDRNVRGYNLLVESIDATGGVLWTSDGQKSVVERDVLPAAMPAAATSLFPYDAVQSPDRGPMPGGFAFIGNTDADFEIALVASGDGTNWTLERGVLDTVPVDWASGTPIWFVNAGLHIVDESNVRAAGETVDYKCLTFTSQGSLDQGSASTISGTLTGRPWLPLRPANVQVNGVGFGVVPIGVATSIDITWATRNRTTEEGQAVLWTDAPVTPEYQQETIVTIKDGGGTVLYTQGSLWTENALSLAVADFAASTDIFVTVSAQKNGLDSLQSYTLHVSGLPGTSGTLPTPPAPTSPVSPIPAPTTGVWTATGTAITDDDGSIPAIKIAGAPTDNPSALALVVQYRKDGTTTWYEGGAIDLQDQPVSLYITGLGAATLYDVQCAYQVQYEFTQVILSSWFSLGSVTTGIAASNLKVEYNGTTETPNARSLNFTGAGVTVTDDGAGNETINVPGTMIGPISVVADGAVVAGTLGYFTAGGAATADPTDATKQAQCLFVSGGISGATVECVLPGSAVPVTGPLTLRTNYWLGASGATVTGRPTATGSYAQVVGYAITTTLFFFGNITGEQL